MDVDEDCNSNQTVFRKPLTPGLSFGNQFERQSPQQRINERFAAASSGRMSSFSQTNTPIKSHARRGSSGLFYNYTFCGYFRHLKKLHMESMEGLNIIKQPPARAVFRSSLPATPIATPIYRETFPFFTEQSLLERLCRTPSPRRSTCSRNSCNQMDTDEMQPMDITSPTIDEEESSGSSPNQNPSIADFNSNLDSIYYKINDQFNPD
ncbi:hypothetical protein RDWZM_004226 [Blomia tropicalis]|uniref:Uncharacterized protein n=1 Tax=Blomia tropicalis TaxID=40697 RepID=A0A9Q0RTB3_BLOTA|nr:hypothetical protein BLOT_016449 [Blomia tropicalis]KAJ6225681.1 hypothetical protein RDWZM_004226 [Blomia tropicalis]